MNMSYCRFNNTNLALNDCLDVFEEPEGETISEEEKYEAKSMFDRFLEFCLERGIVEDYNKKVYDELIDSFEE